MHGDVVTALNRQIVIELDSSYLYLQMAEWFDKRELRGFGACLRQRAHEEVEHALVLFDHLLRNGAKVSLGRVDDRRHRFMSVREVMGKLLLRGKFIASGINLLLDLSQNAEDDETRLLVAWFAAMQLQEEAYVVDLLGRVNACKAEDGGELRELDAELAERAFPESLVVKNRARGGIRAG